MSSQFVLRSPVRTVPRLRRTMGASRTVSKPLTAALPLVGSERAKNPDGSSLSGAVRPKKPKYLAPLNGKRYVTYRNHCFSAPALRFGLSRILLPTLLSSPFFALLPTAEEPVLPETQPFWALWELLTEVHRLHPYPAFRVHHADISPFASLIRRHRRPLDISIHANCT